MALTLSCFIFQIDDLRERAKEHGELHETNVSFNCINIQHLAGYSPAGVVSILCLPRFISLILTLPDNIAKELENLNNNDQRETLGAAIRSHNERINAIDEDIESKMNMRKRYQRSATMQNKLNLLKENRAKDASKLKDMLESKTANLNSFDIDVPNDLDDEANIAPFVRETQNTISNKYIDAARKVTEAQEAEAKTRQAISQEQGTNRSLIQSRNDLQQRKNVLCQAENSVGKIKALIPVLVDRGFKIEDFVIEKDDPQILLDTLDDHLKRLDDNSPEQLPPESVAKLMRKIKKLVSSGVTIWPTLSVLLILLI